MAGKKMIGVSLKASTIVEVIVAMIIIVVMFGIAMMIYTNVVRTSPSFSRLKAAEVLDTVMATEETGIIQTGEKNELIGGMRIDIKVDNWNDNARLFKVALQAFDQNQQPLGTLRKIILKP